MEHGLFVVLVGSDGSGKSSLCRDLPLALADRAEVVAAYFGSGDGPSSPLRWPLVQLRRLAERGVSSKPVGPSAPSPAAVTDPGRKLRGPKGLARAAWAITLSIEKSAKLRRARADRTAGRIVIADRYPQAQVPGINDGPLLHPWCGAGPVRRRIARWEAAPYEDADRHGPDLVLRLVVGQDQAERRRPEHDPADLARRRALVQGLRFTDPATTVVDLDTDAPYDDVLAAALYAIRQAHRPAIGTSPATPSAATTSASPDETVSRR